MIRTKPFPPHPVIEAEEIKAVEAVLKSGNLSSFIASAGDKFLGGKKVREFEKEFSDYHGTKYAVAFNSATAALHAAVIACGVEPGDEVITTPYTFTSTATCALMANAIPVFADVKENTFNINPNSIVNNLSNKTRAVIAVHLFGNPVDINIIQSLCEHNNLKLIEDCAQAPGAETDGKKVGTFGDCGIFSFTESKAITCGEGGMLITDDLEIAEIARLVRNHGEAIEGKERTYKSSILGYNYRMTEMEAALGKEQFRKLDMINSRRITLSNYLNEYIKTIKGFTPQLVFVTDKCVYYMYGFRYDENVIGMERQIFVTKLRDEGIPVGERYIRPLYLSSIYQDRKPYIYRHCGKNVSYDKGICPIAERLYEKEMVTIAVCRPPAKIKDIADIREAIRKVIDND